MKLAGPVSLLSLVVWCLAPQTLPAQVVWNPTTEFSTANGNPNGVWTYGWMDNSFATFTTYTNHTSISWFGWGGDQTPGIWFNTGNSTVNGAPPGFLSLHPGNGGEPSVLRWTAPAGALGLLHISGQFFAGDGGTMQVAIFQNSRTNTLWSNVDAGTFDLSINVTPGDTINFAVFGGYAYGSTPIQLNLAGIPEPSAFALLGVGLAMGAAHQLIRRRSHRRQRTSTV